MANAKKEFLRHIKERKVLCVEISYQDCWYKNTSFEYKLPVGYTEEQYNAFIESLDFEYDSGYGAQELFGTVWLEDGTWCTRGEYDGSEWWVHNHLPEIPSELL